MVSLNTIQSIYKPAQTANKFDPIDNIFGEPNSLFAYHSKIPIIYDIHKNSNINLFNSNTTDSLTLYNQINKDYYEIKYFAKKDSIYTVFYTIGDHTFYRVLLNNTITKESTLNIPIKHIPLSFSNDTYTYGIITKENINIKVLKL